MLDLLNKLCSMPGVSSDEGAVREYIIRRVERAGASAEIDSLGNVLAFKKGNKKADKKIMLCAHMDEVGLMITYIHDNGYLSFGAVGGIDPRVIIGKRVIIGEDKISGVIGLKPPHLSGGEEKSSVPDINDMLLDIGTGSGEEAEKMVSLGDTAYFDSMPFMLSGDMLKARAIDDRLGCAVMLKLMESDLPVDCHFAFTVQEEVGCHGAFAASFSVNPDIALILEGTTAADLPSVPDSKRICSPGKGVVIPFMDGGTVYDRELYIVLTSLADRQDIPWQTKRYIAGGTDAQIIQRSRTGVKVAALAAAVRNIHSPASIANTIDMQGMLELAKLFLEEMPL